MSDTEKLLLLMQIVGPSAAAYVAVKVAIAVALERAQYALSMAKRAHERIDRLMDEA